MPAPLVAAAGIGAAGAIGSALIGSNSSKKAAKSQKKAAKKAAAIQQNALKQQLELSKPYVEAGKNALVEYEKLAPYQSFGMPQFEADPGYQFRMSEGIKALERSASARGLLSSGTTLKGITQYGQNVASQEYENAFSRYLTEREARMDPYRYLTGVGQAAAAGQAANIGSTGAQLAELAATRGNINAQAAIGTANAYGGALNTLSEGALSYAANQPYMNYLSAITPGASAYAPTYTSTTFGGPK